MIYIFNHRSNNINDGEEWNLSGTISGLWSRIFESGLEGLVVPRNYDGLGREINNGILITRPYSPDVMSEVDDHLKVQFDFVYSSCISWAIDLARVNHTSVTPRRIRRFGVSKISRNDFNQYLGNDQLVYWC